jgi:integrase
MRGSISKRGKRSWRLKFDVERVGGRRQIRYVTVKGTRKDAEAELARLVHEVNTGTLVDPSTITVGEWLHKWLAAQTLSPRAAETYAVVVGRLVSAIGTIPLQKLKPVHVHDMQLLKRDGTPVAPATARQARRVLKAALQSALDLELVHRNVGAIGKPPAAGKGKVDTLTAAEISRLLEALKGSDLLTLAKLALSSGARRGELLALRWSDINLEASELHIERTLERTTKHGVRFKPPKTDAGLRTISLPPSAVSLLRDHRKQQLELRMQFGLGKPDPDALVFCKYGGAPLDADHLATRWRRAIAKIEGFPKATLHWLRHTHCSALIAAGRDPVEVARRMGHSSPVVTMSIYAHAFRDKPDTTSADAIEKLLG